MQYGALPLSRLITLRFHSLQKAIHTPGGLEKPMRSTTIGVDQDPAFKNVPAASNATALIPSTTATVMLTISNGECFTRRQGENDQNLLHSTAIILNVFCLYISLLIKEQRQKYYICDPYCKVSTHLFVSILFTVFVTVK